MTAPVPVDARKGARGGVRRIWIMPLAWTGAAAAAFEEVFRCALIAKFGR